ncbi:MAG: nuclear transport factor 2 family protein [Vicinamibacterales bacterium]
MASNPVERYLAALGAGDFDVARACLADDFTFSGWFGRYDSPDAYLAAMRRLRGFVEGMDVRHVFAHGPEVCLIYTSHTRNGDAVPAAAWFRLDGDRIRSLEVICDSRPFQAFWQEALGESDAGSTGS